MSQKNVIENFIAELQKYEDCIFRGESQHYHDDIHSGLYRKFFTGKKSIQIEDKDKERCVLEIEQDTIKKVKHHFSKSTTDIEILTEMQHLGGKTCLLDFSYNVFIALFFACSNDSVKDGRIILLKKEPVADTLGYTNESISDREDNIIINPTGKSPRVVFQNSVFVHSKKGYLNKDEYDCIKIKKEDKPIYLEYLKNIIIFIKKRFIWIYMDLFKTKKNIQLQK